MANFTQAQTEIKQALDAYFGLYGSGDAMYASGNNLGSTVSDPTKTNIAALAFSLADLVESFVSIVNNTGPIGELIAAANIGLRAKQIKEQAESDGVNISDVASLISDISAIAGGGAILVMGPAGIPVFAALSAISLVAGVFATASGANIAAENNALLLSGTQALDHYQWFENQKWLNQDKQIYESQFKGNPVTLPVLALMKEIDDNISLATAKNIIENSGIETIINGSVAESSNVLKYLTRIFLNADLNELSSKQEINAKVNELWAAFENNPLKDNVTFVAALTSGAEARDDLAKFLSLFYLTPFALQVNDAGANNFLYSIHEPLADKWNDDLNLTTEQIQSGEANFSDTWLKDRAEMLSVLIEANQNDKNFISRPNLLDNVVFQDLPSDTSLRINGMSLGIGITPQVADRYIIFGSGQGNVINGGERGDHLYGMGGNDQIDGGENDDYIEGNAGQDQLNGGEGNDILMGGTEVDIMDGGEGNDQLKGGDGVDVYQFSGAYGIDIITDSDGLGFITIDNNPINSGTFLLQDVYVNNSTGATFTRVNSGNTVVVSNGNDSNRIIISDWSEIKNLGIELTGAMPIPPAGNVISGDFKKAIDDKGTPEITDDVYLFDINGNYIKDAQNPSEPNAADLITGTAGVDVINGLGGSDAIRGRGGDDYINGGAGGDLIQGGAGKDTLIGGGGNDWIYGAGDRAITYRIDVDELMPVTDLNIIMSTGVELH